MTGKSRLRASGNSKAQVVLTMLSMKDLVYSVSLVNIQPDWTVVPVRMKV